MKSVSVPDIEVVEADMPYGNLPYLPYGGEMLAWYRSEEYPGEKGQSVLISDLCIGDPPIQDVAKFVSHEYLHHILEELVSVDASIELDAIVDNGDYIADREENVPIDDRPLKERWEHKVPERYK